MPSQQISRREFVTATAALTAAATLPSGRAAAQPAATHRRMSISDAGFPQSVLESYKKAIRAMLALPPSDPRNWYRHAIVHALDCPHGNWWFLVWHRGYIGWFEQICRELSGDPDFALPYWDWTREPRVPAGMFDDVLTPTNPAYIPSLHGFPNAVRDRRRQLLELALRKPGRPAAHPRSAVSSGLVVRHRLPRRPILL